MLSRHTPSAFGKQLDCFKCSGEVTHSLQIAGALGSLSGFEPIVHLTIRLSRFEKSGGPTPQARQDPRVNRVRVERRLVSLSQSSRSCLATSITNTH